MNSIREDLISILKENQGAWVSGERLSDRLSVSRSAVWKHMVRLKKEGYEIRTAPRKGYLLTGIPDSLLVREISEGLGGTLFEGAKIIIHRETASTNRSARDLALRGYPEGTIVLAERQDEGKGRKGRIWLSPEGKGIYLSLILRPPVTPGELPRMAVLTAVAAAEALEEDLSTPSVTIKWPNDLLLDGRKIGGILLESHAELDLVDFLVVGLGINISMTDGDFPPELHGRATSLLLSTGRTCPRLPVIRTFLSLFDRYYRQVLSGDFTAVRDRWTAFAGISGKRITVGSAGRPVTGVALGLDDSGILVLRQDSGESRRVYSGDLISVSSGKDTP